jgi:curved DNA-binding protein CbpA
MVKMNLNSPFFDRIRTRRRCEAESVEPADVGCDHPGCREAARHRAPKGRYAEGEYWRFCLDHVKAYNQTYNYFNGMSENDVRAYQKDALTGHRPTWKAGLQAPPSAVAGIDQAQLLRARMERLMRAREAARAAAPTPGKPALRALETLGLDPAAGRDAVRARFKALAKRFHPDLNEGDRSREDRLREIIAAYTYLKSVGLA